MNDRMAGGLVVLLIAAVLFLVFRAFWLWYWKISEIVTLLKSIDAKLDRATPTK